MKASTLQAKLDELGIRSAHSRPRVSNDNAYSESRFRTLKYCPQWPAGALKRSRMHGMGAAFTRHYNEEHRHGGIRFGTPSHEHGFARVQLGLQFFSKEWMPIKMDPAGENPLLTH